MRVYVTGLGSIGHRHVSNLQLLLPAVELIVNRPGGGRALPDWINALPHQTVGGPEEAIALGVDLAVVCSATSDHIDVLLPLIAARVPMYVEKPVVATREQFDSVASALSRTGYRAPTLVGCNLRFLPSLRKLRDAVRGGAIGRVVRAGIEAGQWLPDWRPSRDYRTSYSADASRGGGVVLDLIHELDAARWLLGEFDSVQSDLGSRSTLSISAEDTAGILLSRRGGPLAVIALDYVARRPIRRYEIVGDSATLTWDLPARSLTVTDRHETNVLTESPQDFDVAATYAVAMAEFLRSVESGAETSQPLEEGLASIDLALRVKESAHT